jgi:peroxiredoxin (alkyl hydroperoxide reductase subunit C)
MLYLPLHESVYNQYRIIRESKGKEATPSGWRPGKITLKPGPELVGKVWEVWKTEMAFDWADML